MVVRPAVYTPNPPAPIDRVTITAAKYSAASPPASESAATPERPARWLVESLMPTDNGTFRRASLRGSRLLWTARATAPDWQSPYLTRQCVVSNPVQRSPVIPVFIRSEEHTS